MNDFTKGEWEAGRSDIATFVDDAESKWIYAGDKYCAIASGLEISSWTEVMANANLIATAGNAANALASQYPNMDAIKAIGMLPHLLDLIHCANYDFPLTELYDLKNVVDELKGEQE